MSTQPLSEVGAKRGGPSLSLVLSGDRARNPNGKNCQDTIVTVGHLIEYYIFKN